MAQDGSPRPKCRGPKEIPKIELFEDDFGPKSGIKARTKTRRKTSKKTNEEPILERTLKTAKTQVRQLRRETCGDK